MPAMNVCMCYHEKMRGICPQAYDSDSVSSCSYNRFNGHEKFLTFLTECDKDAANSMSPYATAYDWCSTDESSQSSYYSSSSSGPTATKHSTKSDCFSGGPPTTDCTNVTIIVDLFDWPQEVRRRVENTLTRNADISVRTVAAANFTPRFLTS